MSLKTITSSAWTEISLEIIENMFVIPVLPEAIIEENETNEIIHDFEDDNEGN